MSITKFDLSDHKKPGEIFNEIQAKYPDEKVKISLEEKTLLVEVDSSTPLQQKINVFSFISQRIQESRWSI